MAKRISRNRPVEQDNPARFDIKEELIRELLAGQVTMGEVGRRLRTEGLNMSQAEVCKLLGLSRQVVSDIENNQGNPRLASLRSYFKLMGFEVSLLPRSRDELTDYVNAEKMQEGYGK